jgi:hypothetical protein
LFYAIPVERRLVESETRSLTAIYGVAVLCAIGALLVRLPLNPVLESRVPYITFPRPGGREGGYAFGKYLSLAVPISAAEAAHAKKKLNLAALPR